MGTAAQLLQTYGLIAVGLLIFLEDFGVPVPGETILIAASITASQGGLSILLVALVAVVAAVAGDNVGWVIGHFGGRRALYALSCRVRVRGHYILAPSRLRWAEGFFQRHGAWIITVARFFDVLRQANGLVAGALAVRWLVFFAFNVAGALLWVGAWASIGYFLGSAVGANYIERLILYVFAALVAIAIGSYLVRRLIRRLRHATTIAATPEEQDRICREERGEEETG